MKKNSVIVRGFRKFVILIYILDVTVDFEYTNFDIDNGIFWIHSNLLHFYLNMIQYLRKFNVLLIMGLASTSILHDN